MRVWSATSPWLKRIAAVATIAGAACALTVQPASADEHWQRYHRKHKHHHYHPRDVRPVYPPAVHYYNPPVVYPAYPVYRAPPPVYAPPPGLSITIPFR